MNEKVPEELISAYVDGELTAEEQALVERALAESQQCRRVYDDYLALRAGLQSMPRKALDEQFTHRVLKRIQDRTPGPQGGSPPSSPKPGPGKTPGQAETSAATPRRSRRSRPPHRLGRPLAWMIAAAAALLLAVYLVPFRLGTMFDAPSQDPTARQTPSGPSDDRSRSEEESAPQDPPTPPIPPKLADDEQPESPRDDDSRTNGSPAAPDSPEAIVQSPIDPRSVPPRPPQPPEIQTPPQVASKEPAEGEANAGLANVEPVDLAFDYGEEDLQVVRLAVSRQAVREDRFGEILQNQGLGMPGSESSLAKAQRSAPGMPAPVAPVQVVLVHGHPAHLHEVAESLKNQPEDFRPWAVYTVPPESFDAWLVTAALSLPNQPEDAPTQPGRAQPPLDAGSLGGGGLLPFSADPAQKVFAWRGLRSTAELIDEHFPVPEKQPLADARKTLEEVSPDAIVQTLFLLYPRQSEPAPEED